MRAFQFSAFDEMRSCTCSKAAALDSIPSARLASHRFYRLKREDLTHATTRLFCLTALRLYLQIHDRSRVLVRRHTQKEFQNNTGKNTHRTFLKCMSMARQKLKFHVWQSCFPYRPRNSVIVWTADGCSITTMTKDLSVTTRSKQ